MSEVSKPEGQQAEGAPAQSAPVDEIKNLKAEMNRKMSNLEATNAQLLEQLKTFAKPAAPAPASVAKKVSVFDDEDQFAESVVSAAEERISKKLAAQQEAQAKHQQVIGGLMNEFPELGNNESELTKKANEIYASMSDEDKSHRLAIDSAVRRAALETGLKPKSKRTSDESESFSLGSGGSGGSSRRNSDAVNPLTEQFAKLMGVDPEKAKARAKARKNYNNWE